jgi:hypothetical protein
MYVQRFGRYEFSNGPLQFELLVKKSCIPTYISYIGIAIFCECAVETQLFI